MEFWKSGAFSVVLSIIWGIELHPYKAAVRIWGDNVWGKNFENCKALNKWKVVLFIIIPGIQLYLRCLMVQP